MTHRNSKELRIFMNEHHDNCSLCGRPFSEGDTAYLGYRKDNSCALLCDKCSDELKETVDRYYWMKREYEVPRPSDVLWRYMDLSKLIYLIAKRALYFPSAECFPDNFEGAKGSLDRKSKWDDFYLNFFKKAVSTAPGQSPQFNDESYITQEAQRLLAELHYMGAQSRKNTYISCWHMSDYESEAMWKLYSKDNTNAVAIQTTY